MQICGYLLGLSWCSLHIMLYLSLFGPVVTIVIIGIQLLLAIGIIYIRIRAPD